VGYAGHVVDSGASGAWNVTALFFKLGWDWYGFDKERAGTSYAELVCLHLEGSTDHIVHSGATGAPIVIAIFFMLRWDRYGFDKKRHSCVFASGGICGSCSAFKSIWGMKCRCIFMLRWAQCGLQKRVLGHVTHNLCFASCGMCGSRSAFWCVRGAKRDRTIFQAREGPVWIRQKVH
jgi:hypothetical protein